MVNRLIDFFRDLIFFPDTPEMAPEMDLFYRTIDDIQEGPYLAFLHRGTEASCDEYIRNNSTLRANPKIAVKKPTGRTIYTGRMIYEPALK